MAFCSLAVKASVTPYWQRMSQSHQQVTPSMQPPDFRACFKTGFTFRQILISVTLVKSHKGKHTFRLLSEHST